MSGADPAVSVLLPVRDGERTLLRALASVRRQTLSGWECVVVDDGSTDASAAVARAVARRDSRFRLLGASGRGLVAALGDGLSACRAPWVARMDADDVMHSERLALQLEAVTRDPSLTLVGAHVRTVARGAVTDGRLRYQQWLASLVTADDIARELLVECPLAHPTFFGRREVLERFGYSDAGWPEDYDLLLRLHLAGHRLGVVPRPLLAWSDHPARLSRTHPRYAPESFVRLKAWFLRQRFLADGDDYVQWGFGGTGKALCRALRSLGCRPRLIVELHPRRVGQRIHGAPVVRPEALTGYPPGRMVVSVAGGVARAEIRARLAALGWTELEHFVCAA